MRRFAVVLVPLILTLAACATTPPPAPVDQEIENLRTFAKLYGYVRWFHPSDEASAIDWDRFAVHGADRVQRAKDVFELADELDALFAPIAPTMAITVQRGIMGAPTYPDCAAAESITAWDHVGVGLGPASNMYRSTRSRWHSEEAEWRRASQRSLSQLMPADLGVGQQIRLRTSARATGGAFIWLRTDRSDGSQLASNAPVSAGGWKDYELIADVPPDTVRIVYGMGVDGAREEVSFRGFDIAVKDDGQWIDVSPFNADFEAGFYGHLPRAWSQQPLRGFQTTGTSGPDGAMVVTLSPTGNRYPLPNEWTVRNIGVDIDVGFPTALPVLNDRTCPSADPVALQSLQDQLATVDLAPGAASRAIRDGGVIAGWNVLQHFYPYFDEVDVDWDDALTDALVRSRADPDGGDHLPSLRRLLNELDDGHASAFHYRMHTDRNPSFSVDAVGGEIVVVATAHEQIEIGDVVRTIDGEIARKAVERGASVIPGSPQHKQARALAEFGRGLRDTAVVVGVERGGEIVEVIAVRDQRQPLREARPEPIAEIEPGIWYVDLSRVTTLERLEKLAAARGVVFDMRGYPRDYRASALGHLTDDPLDSAQWHLPLAVLPDQELVEYHIGGWQVLPREPRFTGTPVFLTGSRAISASETLMGIVEYYALGEVVGAPTAGVNGNINLIDLPGGYRLVFTGMKVRKHDGSPHHVIGVKPTVPVERSIAAIREGRDEYIEKAVEIINANGAAVD
ncbi:MAG: S41 family peptidase [Gammaproteobacteria bacterium]